MTRHARPLRPDDHAPMVVAGLVNAAGPTVRVVHAGAHLSFSVPILTGPTRKNVRRHVPLTPEA